MALPRWIKDGLDRVMERINYYPVSTMFALQDQSVARADRDRQANESMALIIVRNDVQLADIEAILAETEALPPDAPPAVLRHNIAKAGALIEGLLHDAKRRIKAREQAMLRPRDAHGRFLPSVREIES